MVETLTYSLDARLPDVEERGRDGWNVNRAPAASGRVYCETDTQAETDTLTCKERQAKSQPKARSPHGSILPNNTNGLTNTQTHRLPTRTKTTSNEAKNKPLAHPSCADQSSPPPPHPTPRPPPTTTTSRRRREAARQVAARLCQY